MTVLKPILIEGYTPEEILGLPPKQFKAFVFTGKPLVFKAGSAQFLGEFDLRVYRELSVRQYPLLYWRTESSR